MSHSYVYILQLIELVRGHRHFEKRGSISSPAATVNGYDTGLARHISPIYTGDICLTDIFNILSICQNATDKCTICNKEVIYLKFPCCQ